MKTKPTLPIEPERYEFVEKPLYNFDINRRDFLKFMGGGICVISLLKTSTAHETDVPHHLGSGEQNPDEIGAWLHINQEGHVHVFTGKVEVGQNIRTSLSQAVAEELYVPIESITMVMGDTHQVPYDRGTYGSLTTPTMALHLRHVSAAAREMLIDIAVEKFKVDRKQIHVHDGKVIHKPSNRSVPFGELTQGKELLKIIDTSVNDKPAAQWNVCGTSVPKIKGHEFVTGKHQYSYDLQFHDMMIGKILRPPQYKSRLRSLNTNEANKIKGVTVVQDGNFVGITAPDEPTANRALRALKAEWDTSDDHISSDELFSHLKKTAQDQGRGSDTRGSLQDGLESADKTLDTSYTLEYIAHTPLEPRAAVAKWDNDTLTAWVGTQRPFGVQEELSRMFSMPKEKVRVIMPDTGSGYGGKHTGEAALEAARLAKEIGKPVKIAWTREEEFTWAYFRPAGVMDVKSGITQDGKITAWEFHNYNSGTAGIDALYNIPNQRIQFHRCDSPMRQGSYRCLAAPANHFARESHIDELAHLAQMDPLQFRLKNMDNDRLRDVLLAAADKFDWKNKKSTQQRGYGLACGSAKNGYVATCVEISIEQTTGKVDVVHVVEAFDCGPVVNPNHMKNQIEGMILMGIGGALFEAIEFKEGKIVNPFLSSYRVPRFQDAPKIDMILMDRKDVPAAGGGEAPIIGIAPAIANAIYNATGKRIRRMPLAPNGIHS